MVGRCRKGNAPKEGTSGVEGGEVERMERCSFCAAFVYFSDRKINNLVFCAQDAPILKYCTISHPGQSKGSTTGTATMVAGGDLLETRNYDVTAVNDICLFLRFRRECDGSQRNYV